jgi:hypothetical protein
MPGSRRSGTRRTKAGVTEDGGVAVADDGGWGHGGRQPELGFASGGAWHGAGDIGACRGGEDRDGGADGGAGRG